ALVGLSIGAALTLAYSLGGLIVPTHERGAAFGWLALGVQIGTAASPLATGALAAASLPGAFIVDGAIAWVGAALLVGGGRGPRAGGGRAGGAGGSGNAPPAAHRAGARAGRAPRDQIPRPRRNRAMSRSKPSSRSTSSVCAPSSGAGRRTRHGV